MKKLLALPVILLVGLIIACSGGRDTTTVTIHGHGTESVYGVQVPADQVENFLLESGVFKCDDIMCHIEGEHHDE